MSAQEFADPHAAKGPDGWLTLAGLPSPLLQPERLDHKMARQDMDRTTPETAIVSAADRGFLSPAYQHPPTSATVDIGVLELLAARLCHEMSGPMAAINNGVELLAEEDADPESSPGTSFMRDAVTLIGDSARRAGSRLQFYRFAYGFRRGGTSAGPAPCELALGLFDGSRIACYYAESIRALSLEWQKLACNLLAVGADTLPRGGRLALTGCPLALEAAGDAAALSREARAALVLGTPIVELTARTVQAHFTGLLAQALGCRVIATAEPGRVRLTAVATAA